MGKVERAAALDPRVKPEDDGGELDDGRELDDPANKKARRIAPADLHVVPS